MTKEQHFNTAFPLSFAFRRNQHMDLILRAVLLFVAILAGALLFTPYEAFLEGMIAIVIVAAAVVGFAMHPRREVFYVRTSVRLIAADRSQASEKDLLAVRVEVARLWLLFAPTFLAVAFLVLFATGGPTKFSFLNWIFTSRLAYLAFFICLYSPLLVLLLLWEWIAERRVMRDAEACSARSFSIYPTRAARFGRVSYQFMGEHGEYYGGECAYFKLIDSRELAVIVFHSVRTPELNRIAMGFLFHRLIILGRGVTELDKETAVAQAVLAETASLS
ncbi:MAG: hypothetical protein WA774_09945 [Candidatus Acidiferrales bacterium]